MKLYAPAVKLATLVSLAKIKVTQAQNTPTPDPLTPTPDPLTRDPLFYPTMDPLTPTRDPLWRPPTPNPTPDLCGGLGSCSINPDPHYNVWSPGVYYDFQGGCDQYAIDNPFLQVQIRTRPRNWYSTITQIAILFKESGEIFRVKLDGQVDNTITGTGLATYDGPRSYYWGGSQHKIYLGNITSPASYFQIHQSSYGISFTAYGCGVIFDGSEGMCGSWDSGGLKLKTASDSYTPSSQWGSIQNTLAVSWKVGADSLLVPTSDICDPSSSCGPGEAFECDAVDRKLQSLLIPGCDKTCADIEIPQFRDQCEQDVSLTGDTSWACSAAYEDPIVVPTPKPTNAVVTPKPTNAPAPTPNTTPKYADAITPKPINAPPPANGCYRVYSSVAGTSYFKEDWVSATITTKTPLSPWIQCTPNVDGCPPTGQKQVGGVSFTKRHNFKCISNKWCSNIGYGPGGTYSDQAWEKQGSECSGTAKQPIPKAWSGTGCPKAYAGSTYYDAGDLVSVNSMVYMCKDEPSNQFCGMEGFGPGVGYDWESAWTPLGSCSGTLTPSSSPNFKELKDMGGCPDMYRADADYEEGDRVSSMGLVYQCKTWPLSLQCSQAGFEPNVDLATPDAWKEAWQVVGYCDGTITPTSSPNFVVLEDMGGCGSGYVSTANGGSSWQWGIHITYEEGDRIAVNGLMYACKAWPYSGHCSQDGYEPGTNPATPGAWKAAWTLIGYCSGSIGPTSSPAADPVNFIGACPDEWSGGIHTKYEAGDLVSVTVSNTPLRNVVFRCKNFPESSFCAQHSPMDKQGGSLGWVFAGSCDGSVGPTSSPSFDSLTISDGCPKEYSSFKTDYEVAELVSKTLSTSPIRKIVYECREWPNTGFCNQSGYKPGTKDSHMAWKLKGACDGTSSPTASPVKFIGTCQYYKCLEVSNCVPGSSGCSCNAGESRSSLCTKTECTLTDVTSYNTSTKYAAGDIVRIGTQKFKCKEWPHVDWCSDNAYEPNIKYQGPWSQAWTKDGTC